MAPNRIYRYLPSFRELKIVANPRKVISILLLSLGCQQQAHAFFCFNFGGHTGTNGYGANHRHPFILPPPPPYPLAMVQEAVENGRKLPALSKEKPLPDIIQGYRFRPLERVPPPSGLPMQQTDRRH